MVRRLRPRRVVRLGRLDGGDDGDRVIASDGYSLEWEMWLVTLGCLEGGCAAR
jgi:hypothetical protein